MAANGGQDFFSRFIFLLPHCARRNINFIAKHVPRPLGQDGGPATGMERREALRLSK